MSLLADPKTNLPPTPALGSGVRETDGLGPGRNTKRIAVALVLVLLAVFPGELGSLTRTLMTDAYVQVSAFVAATLMLFYGAEKLFKFDLGQSLKNAKGAQVPLAAILGSTPGCGGAVIVVAAYSSGNISFGAVVATLTATMGDAAFLLIATRPDAAMVVLPLSFGVGIISGYVVDRVMTLEVTPNSSACHLVPEIGRTGWKHIAYGAIALPGLGMGAMQLAQMDIETIFGAFLPAVALAGVFVGLFIWATSPVVAMTNARDSALTRTAEETSFISVWVVGAYLAYDYLVAFAGLDLEAAFRSVAPLLPLIAIVIGFVPGCGPQVLVTTLYINGLVPFAALIGNAISNDGDALFPAIALNPRAAILATLVSALPALLVGYGFYLLAPGFLTP